ncbi:hypothetical protein JW752_02010 [Candidatus Peregrinibacteria bacterium]|nr:hypothetical protein [Candidatus Peregrinibacteria bacterium]
MRLSLKNRGGESILEAIIAMTILSFGVMFSSAIIGSSLGNVHIAKNRVVAVNIAREGIEAVRNIRDTNWLRFATNRRQCWNFAPKFDPNAPCTGAVDELILPGEYIIYKQDTERWRLGNILNMDSSGVNFPESPAKGDTFRKTDENKSYVWDGTQWIDFATLFLVDIDPLTDTDLDHDYVNDTDTYNHVYIPSDDGLGTEADKTIFRRTVKIQYLTNGGGLISTPGEFNAAGPGSLNRMRITVTVTWRDSRMEHTVELSTHITDYLGREQLNG